MSTTWTVRDDENNTLGYILAEDKYAAQDKAQSLHPDVMGLWIEPTTDKD